ncbi:MAG TPA: hypothetical protein VII00_05265 [bacterium]
MAILIMLNNYFHDLAVAVFFSSVVLTWIFIKIFAEEMHAGKLKQFVRFSIYLSFCSFFLILALGVPRAVFYRQYEWMDAAGRGQVTVLVIKHILLASLTVMAIVLQVGLKKKYFK